MYSCGYLEADVFGRCTTYSNRLQALRWANTASQQLILVDRRNFCPTVKSPILSTTKLQPVRRRRLAWPAAAEGSLCWYQPLDQSSRENRFQDGTADHGRYFPGGVCYEGVVGGGIGCVVKCHRLSQADMSLDRQA